MKVITEESDKKRLQSLKEKKQAFKIRGQLIQQALSNVDNIKSNKIIFDDYINEQQNTKSKKKILFDDDNDSDTKEDALWNKDEFNSKKESHVKKNKKVILGNDTRFTLDDRFTEDNHPIEETEVITGIDDLQKEKEKELDILENILGTPLVVKSNKKLETKSSKKGLMIRYDPTENEHCEYEVKSVQSVTKEVSTKKKKRDKPVPEIEEPAPVTVSKDIYYTVSDTLTESLKQKEGFSLLKTYGKDNNDTGYAGNDVSITEDKDKKFRFNFSANNVFKGDSSDEDVDEAPDADKQMIEEAEDDKNICNLFGHKDTLFFDKDDVRFNEAARFFNTEAAPMDEFKHLRRELKQIVRTKIRTNEKRHQPWSKKRKIKKFSQ